MKDRIPVILYPCIPLQLSEREEVSVASTPCRTKRLVYIHGVFDSAHSESSFFQISASLLEGLDLHLSLAREFEVELYIYRVDRGGRSKASLRSLERSRVLSWTRANGIVRQVCEKNADLPSSKDVGKVNTWREFLGV